MSDTIILLVGTMTGTAEMVAEDMMAAIEDDGRFEAEMRLMDDLDDSAFADSDPAYLIVTSTYGQGEVPDNAVEFYEALTDNRPDLSAVRYGVFGLGDATYADTYNHGGQRFDTLLQELGATRVGERFAHDAGSADMPEDKGVEWIKEWIGLL